MKPEPTEDRPELKARVVLSDALRAVELCENAKNEQDFRVHWVAAISLLRAVGHVLKAVDREEYPWRAPIDKAWAEWNADRKKHDVFWAFIRHERNLTLKEYELSFWRDTPSIPLVVTRPPAAGGDTAAEHCEIPVEIYRPMTGGPFEGDDARDVLTSAAEWWERELTGIEGLTARAAAGGMRNS